MMTSAVLATSHVPGNVHISVIRVDFTTVLVPYLRPMGAIDGELLRFCLELDWNELAYHALSNIKGVDGDIPLTPDPRSYNLIHWPLAWIEQIGIEKYLMLFKASKGLHWTPETNLGEVANSFLDLTLEKMHETS